MYPETMNSILEKLGKTGIVPVIKIDDAEKAVPLAKALAAGGVPCAEITFRTAQGEEAIRRIAGEAPEVLVGAGTVLTVDQVDRAIGAGAQFIVSPGFNPAVVSHCQRKGIPITPGCANPSDIEQALEFGLEAVKFFPAEQAGGLEYIKAVSAPYPNLKFIPTGGIHAGNIARYIAFDKVLACGGSWMAGADLINAGEFEKITALSREAVLALLGFSVAHIGINTGGHEMAAPAAALFNSLFGFALKEGNGAVFAGNILELVTTTAPGTHGHIAIATNTIARAIAHLERGGIALDHANARKDAQGNVRAIYLKEEILGFAVHLV
ncbi:MAG: bifunctional 4-hydroxy-2-oxoglutarate aldolase/2-dehydro-3-deoxy-phosphogluconate aldolase [Treponema sp.]|jgi:2-dehydro-3-deoxyphosphogluconate aldolase/(4S)-4-hydroxy-2-oxoglutarate aldolase|nr:bifunctional 4-hydroxy-2-oxoglutarate aldolase/2-dehydro-3-deoxy-phosphogluconate aldolase [Treponema sp.]